MYNHKIHYDICVYICLERERCFCTNDAFKLCSPFKPCLLAYLVRAIMMLFLPSELVQVWSDCFCLFNARGRFERSWLLGKFTNRVHGAKCPCSYCQSVMIRGAPACLLRRSFALLCWGHGPCAFLAGREFCRRKLQRLNQGPLLSALQEPLTAPNFIWRFYRCDPKETRTTL